jgi:hypothetical protein
MSLSEDQYALVPYVEGEQSQMPLALENKPSVKINPQELGLVIVNLQEEIKSIKTRLENLPGYDIGKFRLLSDLLIRRGASASHEAQN